MIKEDKEMCEDDFIDNGFVVVEVNESIEDLNLDGFY